METQVRTPQLVFMQPQRLVVPLFQRPYVWNEENQWEPLWNDVVRVAERVLNQPFEKHHSHFLGAVVLQQVQKQTGQMQERTIIDGQQRLATLQLLLDALQAELLAVQALQPAARIEPLVKNAEPFCSRPEDRFKVWPTNRDRPAFTAVMAAEPPVDYDGLGHRGERMLEAHRFFSEQAREWLSLDGPEAAQNRGAAIETVVRELLQMVVIDLTADENAQEIFETLNARGAQLTAADLIKNFVFQRLLETGTNVEDAYQSNWKEFETGFWETEISVGRLRYPRSAIFLNHWLIARTGEEVVAREVFDRFKRFADDEAGLSMAKLLQQIHEAARVYRRFITIASAQTGPTDRLGLFGYRTGVLESEVIKPLILGLLDPEEPSVPEAQFIKALDVVESWMVRRMLLRATTKNYNQVVAELVALVRKSDRAKAGDEIESYLAGQSSESRYWPDDVDLQRELEVLPAYRRLGRGRLRMVLEAIEDYLRGWRNGKSGLGGERVARGRLAIEHVMPRKWLTHWPVQAGGEADRDGIIHTLGNLTLLTKKLNSKVSNGPWLGSEGKRNGLHGHDVLMLNRQLLEKAGERWTDDAIRARTRELAAIITQNWPVPPNHRSNVTSVHPRLRKKIDLSDLITGGVLVPGMTLFPRRKKYSHRVATLLPDGQVEVDGVAFSSPSDAASAIAGKRTGGWWFFLTDQASQRSLRSLRRDYVDAMAVDAGDDEPDDEEDEDEG
jgi:GNAT superfamily N-acetyltransferase